MKKIAIFISFFTLFLLVGCSKTENPQKETIQTTSNQKKSIVNENTIPTFFFHGYSGGRSSFGSMLKRLESKEGSKKQLILTVHEDATVEAQGTWDKQAINPTIQVLFENNKSTQWNQSRWIRSVFAFMYNNYQVKEANLVGHSMGSVSALDYLERYAQEEGQPKLKKVVFIAGPFNEFIDTFDNQSQEDLMENGPNPISARYQEYLDSASAIPKGIQFQVISGQISKQEKTDEAVPLSSSLAIVHLLKKQGFTVENKIITGKKAQHSQLHENKEVDQEVRQFLWEE